jgi:hypothetical protein
VRSGVLVKFDSQARTVGDDQSRPDALVLHWKQAFVVEAQVLDESIPERKASKGITAPRFTARFSLV